MKERLGGGEAIHGGQRWQKCLHSAFKYTTHDREISVWISSSNCAGREQSAEFFRAVSFSARDLWCVYNYSTYMPVFVVWHSLRCQL